GGLMIHAPADEMLEQLWYAAEEHRAFVDSSSVLRDLVLEGFVQEVASAFRLTASGEPRARGIVRRHRLAEVLFVQAMGADLHDAEVSACEMEHMLSEPVVDRVCTFLGHPPACPHGKAIP